MPSDRGVDQIEEIKPRPVEMQVLCLGLSRTSTMTMMTALNQLGYKCYHMLETGAPENVRQRHAFCWREALNYKVHGIGKAYGPKDFDKMLQNYSAVSDMPCVNFVDELVTAFPKAKVVLTQRDPESWVRSVDSTIYYILSWRIWPLIYYLDPDRIGAARDCLELALTDWTSPHPYYDRKALAAHMPVHVNHIRSLVPHDNLLEFHPRDGWEPLCKFLRKEVPHDRPFPYVNKGQNAANIFKIAIVISLVKRSFPYLLSIGVLTVTWKWGVSNKWNA